MRWKFYLFYVISLILLLIGIIFDKTISVFIAQNRISYISDIMSWLSFSWLGILGTWFVVLVLITSLFLWQENKRKWIFPLWLSVFLSAVVAYTLKLIFIRQRPFEVLDIINLVPGRESSFPSAHAAAVFSTLAILDKEFPKIKWFWIVFAILVAFSRIYVGVHYLTDVVVGALIGYTISLIVLKVRHKKNKKNKIKK